MMMICLVISIKNGNHYILLNSLNSNYEINFVCVMAV